MTYYGLRFGIPGESVPWHRDTHDTTLSAVWWARDPEEPGAGANQGTAETADRTRTGTGPTPTLTARQGTQACRNAGRIP